MPFRSNSVANPCTIRASSTAPEARTITIQSQTSTEVHSNVRSTQTRPQSKEKHLNHSALLSCLFLSEQKRSCSVSHRHLPLFPDQNSKRGRRSMDRKGWRRQERRRRSIYCIRQRPLPSSPTRRPLRKDLPTPHLIPFAAAGTAARRPASDCLP